MTDQYLTRDQTLLAEIETTPGTEETPAAADNNVRCRNLQFSPNFEVDAGDDEHTGSLDGGDPTILGGSVNMSFDVRLAGSGTAGTAPEWGPCVRASGFAETLLAAAITGTATAGSSSTITLADATNVLPGMVIETTGGTGSGQERVVTAVDTGTDVVTVAPAWSTNPDATTTYSVHACALYVPVSSDLETLTLHAYQNSNQAAVTSLRRRCFGAMSPLTFNIGVGQVPQFGFNFSGILPAAPDNIARLTGLADDGTTAPPFRGATAYLGSGLVKFRAFSLDTGAAIAMPDDPAQTYGRDRAATTQRNINGTINPYLKILTTRDVFDDFVGATERDIWLRWGATGGNRFSLYIPRARYMGSPEVDLDGFKGQAPPFRALGEDSGVYLCCD